MNKRAFALTLASLCATATVFIGTLAPASGDEGRRVQFTDSSPITAGEFVTAYPSDLSRCTFNSTFTNVVSSCVAPVKPTEPSPGAYNDKVTGDFQGTGHFAGGAILAAVNDLPTTDIPFESYQPYSLHIEGCGTGTLILHNEGNLDSPTGAWQIVPGSGRGDLLGISGGGTYSTGTPNQDGTTSTYAGHVRCGKHE
jgi:hypothetical protein